MLDDGERLVPGFRDQPRAARVGRRPPALRRQEGRRLDARRQPRHRAAGPRASATASKRLHHDHRRQAHDLPAHGRGGRRRDGRAARPRPAVHDEDDAAARARRTARTCRPGARLRAPRQPSARPSSSSASASSSSAARLEAQMRARGSHNLDDIRRSLRLGMGPCQGGFCIYRGDRDPPRARPLSAEEANTTLRSFLEERWKGVWPILYGDQLRQARLDDWIFQGVLDVEHLPGEPVRASRRRPRGRRRERATSSSRAPAPPGSSPRSAPPRAARRSSCSPRARARRTWRR